MKHYPMGLQPGEVLKKLSWAEIILLLESIEREATAEHGFGKTLPFMKQIDHLEEW